MEKKEKTGRNIFSKFQQKEKKKIFHRSAIIDNIPSMKKEELEGIGVTFHGYDNSKRHMPCNQGFFNNRLGKRLTSGEIVMKINTFTHDFGAKYFTIQ